MPNLTVGVLTKATTRDSASPTRDRERTWWRSEPSSCVLSGSIHSTHLARRSCKVTVCTGLHAGVYSLFPRFSRGVVASFRSITRLGVLRACSPPTTRVDFRSSREKKKFKEIENRTRRTVCGHLVKRTLTRG